MTRSQRHPPSPFADGVASSLLTGARLYSRRRRDLIDDIAFSMSWRVSEDQLIEL